MIEQSPPSNTASPTDTKASLSLADQVATLTARQKAIKAERPSVESSSVRESLKSQPFKSRAFDPEKARRIEEENQAALKREHDAKVKGVIARAGIPKKHRERTDLTGSEWAATKDRVSRLVGTGAIVGLVGPRGTGKTQIAVATILDAAEKVKTCLYVKAMEMFLTIRKSYQLDNVCEADQIKRFTDPMLLVIDEFGVRGETQWEDRLVTHIIDERYDAGHDTILISNQTADELTASAGASVVSRMIETGGIIECKWASYRTPPRKAGT